MKLLRIIFPVSLPFIKLILYLSSCKKDEPVEVVHYSPTPYTIDIPMYFPTKIYITENNPMTVEGIELGRYLFYDGRLAGRDHPDSLMSCNTCHLQQYSFECGCPRPGPLGINGTSTPHAMLSMINLVWNPGNYLWGGHLSKLEDMVWMVIHDPNEMASDTNRATALIQSIEMYPPLFEKAFGTPEVNIDRIGKAITQFIRTMITANSKFDKWQRGEEQLTLEELNGLVLFTTEEGADCFHCHGGDGNPLFTTFLFYNNGLDAGPFNDPTDRYNALLSIGGAPTELDHGAYKASTLRNIELTGPYMHDGRFNTLDEVIEFYSHHLKWSPYIHPLMHKIPEGGAMLTAVEKTQLKAFLLTLTDSVFINNPAFSNPF